MPETHYVHPHGRHDYEYTPSGSLGDMFKNADKLKPEIIKNYAKEIVTAVDAISDAEAKKVIIMDLLRTSNIYHHIYSSNFYKTNQLEKDEKKRFNSDDVNEIAEMTDYWIKAIKKAVIAELKKYLPDEIYLFVENNIKETGHFNTKTFVSTDIGEQKFLKESELSTTEGKELLMRNLHTLRDALQKYPEAQQYIVMPENIGASVNKKNPASNSLTYTTARLHTTNLNEIFFEDDHGQEKGKPVDPSTLKRSLKALIDCLRGVKFLAENGLTMTDINTIEIAKNIGINLDTNRGVLFDLDGLQKIGNPIVALMGPTLKGQNNKDNINKFYAPEYRDFFYSPIDCHATAQSMIWEFGDTINRLAEEQLKILWSSGNIFSNHTAISLWEKLKEFSNKMTAEKPEDRPTFEICITKLEGIVDKYSD